ncbi:MAG: SprT-like domain-containing protein [Thermoplasmata archaeon]
MKEKDVDLSARAAELYYTLCGRFVPTSKINVEYCPYSSLKGTGKMRGNHIDIRISDAFKDSPQDVKNALVAILLCKIAKKPCPPSYTTAFRDYVNSSYMTCLQKELRKFRGKELLVEPKGEVYNLNDSFERINKKYFNNELENPKIAWSVSRARNRLGYLDSTTDIIRISRILDDKNVPISVLDYIVYHELLHIKHEIVYRNCRRTVHTREFKKDERKYEEYESANRWLKSSIWRCSRSKHK